jgi:uncharacterized protein
MRVFVTGATGLIGASLLPRLRMRGDVVTALSRRPAAPGGDPGVSWVTGDLLGGGGDWQNQLAGAQAVVNLAGEPMDGARWTRARKARMEASRVDATRRLVEAIAHTSPQARPGVLVNASAVGYYGPRGEEELDEGAAPGGGFVAELARRWEEEAAGARAAGVRVVSVRFAVVLSRRGGALSRMLTAFKLLVGGPLGRPEAWFPWIHEDDAAGLVLHALDHPEVSGPVNAAAPGLVRMREFARALGGALGRPALIPVPQLALDVLLGELGKMVNPGQKVIPAAAARWGYRFAHPELRPALEGLFGVGVR